MDLKWVISCFDSLMHKKIYNPPNNTSLMCNLTHCFYDLLKPCCACYKLILVSIFHSPLPQNTEIKHIYYHYCTTVLSNNLQGGSEWSVWWVGCEGRGETSGVALVWEVTTLPNTKTTRSLVDLRQATASSWVTFSRLTSPVCRKIAQIN